MVQAFTITHNTNQQQRPRSNAILNDHHNDNMKYDPTRKATGREEHPLEKIDIGQDFTCTYVPTTENEANDVNPMSPISVTLHEPPNHSFPPVIQAQAIGTWDDLVRNGITLGDTGAPAALDPDDHDHPVPVHGQAPPAEEGKEREETWNGLVKVGAVLGEGGLTASEVDVEVKLWGLTCAI